MQVRALTIFLELAHSRSIRQVSQRLDLAPTAIIRLIDQLEHHFQASLFDRSGGGIRLTEAGTLLAERAPSIVADLQTTRSLIDDLRQLDRGRVVIHAGGAVVAELLAPVICDVQSRHPNLRFDIVIASAPSITTAVADGIADIGVMIFTPETGRPLIRLSRPVGHAAFVSPSHPFARHKSVSLEQLATQRLAIPDRSFGVRRNLDAAARRAGIRLDPVFTATSLEVQRELAIRQAAILILPQFCCQREREADLLRAIPLSEQCGVNTTLDVACQPNRALPFASRAFLKALEATFDAMPP